MAGQGGRVDRDAHLLLPPADQPDLRDAGHALEARPQDLVGEPEELLGRQSVGHEGELHDRRGVAVELGHARALGVGGQLADDRVELAGDRVRDQVAVGPVGELDDDQRDPLGRRAGHDVEIGEPGDRALDLLGDLELDLLGPGARVEGRDRDDRDVDVGELVDGQREVGDEADQGDRGRDQADDERPGDRDVRQPEHVRAPTPFAPHPGAALASPLHDRRALP